MRGLRFAQALAAALLAVAVAGSQALAQDYPSRPVKIIVPFGPGGPADVTARQIGSILQENFGQPFVIENRTGAGGVIGTLEVAKSRAGRLHPAHDVKYPDRERIAGAAAQIRIDARSRADSASQLL